jgi:hypothetical protein
VRLAQTDFTDLDNFANGFPHHLSTSAENPIRTWVSGKECTIVVKLERLPLTATRSRT